MVSALLEALRGAGCERLHKAQTLLTVLVPAFNEVRAVDELLRRVLDAPPANKEVLVVDDGSIDGTWDIVRRWEQRGLVQLARHHQNRGKGAAIQTGLSQARGEFTIIQDADLEYDPRDYKGVLEPLLAGESKAVYGSRYLSTEGRAKGQLRLLRHGVSLLNLVARLLYGVRLTDEATCYKALPTSLLRALDLRCQGFEFCPEVTAKLCRLRIPIHEVPIRYDPRSKKEGKKLRLRDGWLAVRELWRWRNWVPGPAAVALSECSVAHDRSQPPERQLLADDVSQPGVLAATLMESMR